MKKLSEIKNQIIDEIRKELKENFNLVIDKVSESIKKGGLDKIADHLVCESINRRLLETSVLYHRESDSTA